MSRRPRHTAPARHFHRVKTLSFNGRGRRYARLFAFAGVLALALIAASCGRAPAPPPDLDSNALMEDEFSVMTYNLHLYGPADRDGTGQLITKPDIERDAVVAIIARARPDVLAVQEIGNPSLFAEFRDALEKAGLDYPHVEYLQRGQSELNLGVLSRFPITDRQPRTEDRYSLGEVQVAVLRGFIDVEIEVRPDYRFRLMVAHLKAKVFHQLGQTEMRRNEARLLNKHIRNHLKDNPEINLLVLGDMNDTHSSAALREVMGSQQQYLRDLRPPDEVGDVWTYFSPGDDEYSRIDFMLVSEGMWPEMVPDKTRVVRHPLNSVASDHRPVLGVFKAIQCKPGGEKPAQFQAVIANEPAENPPGADDSSGSVPPEPGPRP